MEEKLLLAGSGGQGIMLMGKLLAVAATNQGINVTFFPSYGAEVRGGAAHCHVVVSDAEIISPLVEKASVLVVMNQFSLDRFLPRLAKGGLLALNTSLACAPAEFDGRLLAVPATGVANELGKIVVANMVMLAAVNAHRRIVSDEALWEAVEQTAGKQWAHLLDINRKAYLKGLQLAQA